MEKITMDTFYTEIIELTDQLYEKENQNIVKAAQLCAQAVSNDGVIHVFGSGHSIGFGLEMKDRIGSLVCIHGINTRDFVLKGKFSLEEFRDPNNVFERRPGIADQLYDLYEVHPSDIFIIISNSGINGVVIDMAITAKQRGHQVIVVTSWQHTSAEDSRHPSGKKLYELGDVVIDNCGPQGDALIETDGKEKICSVSSITGALIAQGISIEVCRLLKEQGKDCPIYWDEEIEGGKQHNEALRSHYKGRI